MKTSLKIVCGEQAEIKQLLSVKNLHEKNPLLKSEKWVSKNVFFHALAKVFKNAQHLPWDLELGSNNLLKQWCKRYVTQG